MLDLMSFPIVYLQAVLSCKPEYTAYEKKKNTVLEQRQSILYLFLLIT